MSKLVATLVICFGSLALLKLLILVNKKHRKNRGQHTGGKK